MIIIRAVVAWIASILIAFMAAVHILLVGTHKPWEFWLKFWAKALLRIVGVKVHIHGQGVVTPSVIIMNHQSLIDILTLAYVAPCEATFIAKKEVQRLPFIGWVMRKCGCIFIDRKNKEQAISSIDEGLRNKPLHYSVLIFPEGTRSFQENIRPFKKGFYFIAKQTNLPIVPIGQAGLMELARGKNAIRPGDIHLYVGPAIHVDPKVPMDEVVKAAENAVTQCIQNAKVYVG